MASLSPLTTAPTPPRPTHSRLRSTTISSLNNAPASSSTSIGGAESSPTVRLTCWAHKDTDKLPLVILNPKAYPHARDGDIIRITQLDSPAVSGLGAEGKKKGKEVMRGGMLFKYGEKDVAAIDNPRLKLSIRESAVSTFGFKADTETLQLDVVDRDEVTADFIELFFKDQYIGRSDMWRLGCSLEETCIYTGQEITFAGAIKAEVRNIYINGERVSSSYFTSRTKTIFRSASAKYYVFIQVCRETYEFDEDGERYYEKAMDGFLPELFERWHALKANHVVTIVLFSRVSYDPSEIDLISPECLKHNEEVGWYKDFYKVAFDMETIADARPVINKLKLELANFRKIVLLDHHHKPGTKAVIPGVLSYAFQGNVLEAINLALNPYDRHHLDRDFVRTGLCLTLITPGTGYFKVDKHLLRLTTERCNDHGLGLDLVCLNKMPLHSVPLFGYLSANPDGDGTVSPSATAGETTHPSSSSAGAASSSYPAGREGQGRSPVVGPSSAGKDGSLRDPLYYDPPSFAGTSEMRVFFSVVFWVYCSFWSKSSDKKYRKGMFFPRVKMSNIQSLGVLNHDLSTIVLPLLRQQDGVTGPTRDERKALRQAHDARVFAHVEPSQLDESAHSSYSSSTKDTSALSASSRSTLGVSHHSQPHLSSSYRSSLGVSSSFPKAGSLRDRLLLESATHPRPVPSAGLSTSLGRTSPSKALSRPLSSVDPDDRRGAFSKREVPRASPSTLATNVRSSPSNLSQKMQPSPQVEIAPVGRNMSYSSTTTSGTITPMGVGRQSVDASAAAPPVVGPSPPADPAPVVKEPFLVKLGSRLLYPFYAPRITPPTSSAPSIKAPTSPKSPIGPPLPASTVATPSVSTHPPSPITPVQETVRPVNMPISDQTSSRQVSRAPSPRNSYTDQGGLHGTSGSGLPEGSPGMDPRLRNGAGAAPRWQRVVNPCNPSASQMMAREGSQRWQHILPREVNLHRVKWKSLTTPACLPITTHYLPPQTELSSHNLYTMKSIEYPMAEFDESAFIRPSADGSVDKRAVVKEMAMQRLAQGFQVIVAEDDEPTEQPGLTIITNLASKPLPVAKTAHVPKRPLPGGASEALRAAEGSIFMSLSNQIHRLDYKKESDTVTVRQYTRVSKHSTAEIPYEGLVWSSMAPGFKRTEASFSFPSARWETFRWNKLDDLVTGSSEGIDEIESTWRARFILVPSEHEPASIITNNETLSKEEVHIEGARLLVDMFTKARYVPPSESENLAALEPIRLVLSTLDPSQSVQDEAVGKQLRDLQNRRKVTKNHMTIGKMSMAEINKALMDSKTGLGLGEHMWGLRRYPNSFTSDALVDWLYKSCRDIKTVDQAVVWAKKLYDDGLFKHMSGQHKFIHGTYIYQFCPPYGPAVAKASGGWFSSRRNMDKAKAVSAGATPLDSPSSEQTPRLHKKKRVSRSGECIIDLDPHRMSDRAETATLRHDLLFNEKNGFNFEFLWLGITAGLAENMRKQWSERVWRYGLRIVEAPVEQICSISSRSPFRATLHIKLTLPPPDASEFDPNLSGDQRPVSYFYEAAFLQQQGFVLDFESDSHFAAEVDYQYPGKPWYNYSQFVHRTGLAFVQNLGEGKGFLWLNNSLYTDTKRDLKNAGGLSVKARERALRERFVDLCGSEDALRQSYKTARLARERDFEVIELMEGPRGGGAGAAMTKTISNLSANSTAPPTTVTATATVVPFVESEAVAPPAAAPPPTPMNPANAPLPPTPAPVHATLLSPPHDQPDVSHLPSV